MVIIAILRVQRAAVAVALAVILAAVIPVTVGLIRIASEVTKKFTFWAVPIIYSGIDAKSDVSAARTFEYGYELRRTLGSTYRQVLRVLVHRVSVVNRPGGASVDVVLFVVVVEKLRPTLSILARILISPDTSAR